MECRYRILNLRPSIVEPPSYHLYLHVRCNLDALATCAPCATRVNVDTSQFRTGSVGSSRKNLATALLDVGQSGNYSCSLLHRYDMLRTLI